MPDRSVEPAKAEALVFRVVASAGERPEAVARDVASRALGPGWVVDELWDRADDFQARPRPTEPAALDPARAWALTYRLRADPRVAQAEPMFIVQPSGPEAAAPPRMTRSGGDDRPLPGAERDCEWSVKQVRAREAWQRIAEAGQQGKGILIGHPDTGITNHPEIFPRFTLIDAIDYIDGDRPMDDLQDGPLLHPSHGTSTASVIASEAGPHGGAATFVTGIAPQAKIRPLRVARSVVQLSALNLTKAIRHAARSGCHVISMSLGGPFGWWFLHDAVKEACAQGVIVLAAAGNEVRFVVYPAAFDEVIAVAGCNVERRPWGGSSRGSAVDITAPGESVWRARTTKGTPEGFVYDVGMGSGTSYAVATVAGIAALWLAHHGRDSLIRRYGAPGLPAVFKQLLLQTCQKVPGWDTHNYGAGIADADALLAAPLPASAPGRGMRAVRGAVAQSVDASGLRKLRHLFEDVPPVALRSALIALLDTTDEALDERLEEIGDELAMHLAIDDQLHDRVRELAQAAQPPGTSTTTRATRGAPAAASPPAPAAARARLEALASPQLRDGN